MALAPSTSDAVRYAGGWLFDRAMAGWDATVAAPDHGGSRPLRILGVRGADLESAVATSFGGPGCLALAVHAGLYASDERVRRMVLEAREGALADVRFWGEAWPGDLTEGGGVTRHRLSVAARAFKQQALTASATAVDMIGGIEVFRRGGPPLRRPGAALRTGSLTG